MEQFDCKTRIYSGQNSLRSLASLHISRLLIVADPFFCRNGTVNHVAHLSKAQAVEIFDQVTPDPSVTLVAAGTKLAQDFQPDTLLALGGGSAMDCAKAIALFSGLKLCLIAVPTTSGSGSEVTDFAILTHEGIKHPLVDASLQPDIAILDSNLLMSLPKPLIAETGFDLISHAMESWVATGSGPISQCLALQALKIAFSQLHKSWEGDTEVRLSVHTAATMAGMAFRSAGLGLCHAISHALGGQFHKPHGQLNAILLPAVIDANSAAADSYAQLAQLLGYGNSESIALRNLKNALLRLRRQLKLPETLLQAGIDPALLRKHRDTIVAAALADPCCATNPVPADEHTILHILQAVTGHG